MGTKGLASVSTKLRRIAELAKRDSSWCLTTLAHHIDVDFLYEAYRQTRKDGALGVDGQSAEKYARNLDENLRDLLERFKSGNYFAPPVKRVYIEKGDGKKRPLGIPTFEDKVLQRAVKMVLEAVYEQDFLDCSYGFRPKRSVHDALDTIRAGTMGMRGGWILDADIQAFFDRLDHSKLREILDQRVRDGVIRRQVDRWLKAGILEEQEIRRPTEGTPQGGVISPLLANVYLHEAVDVWFERDVKPRLRGPAFLVRYADDFVMVFKHKSDADKVLEVLPKRLNRFGLTLHPDKTKLVRYTRPVDSSQGKGRDQEGNRPETFDLLGFTHFWARSRQGYWVIKLKTASKATRRALTAIWQWCRRYRDIPVSVQHEKLTAKLRGLYQFYLRPGNTQSLWALRHKTERAWRYWLSRRSQKAHISWGRFRQILRRYPLPMPLVRRVT